MSWSRPRGTRSSRRSPALMPLSRQPSRGSARSRRRTGRIPARSGFEWARTSARGGSVAARARAMRRTTSASMSTTRRGSRRPATAARSCSRRRSSTRSRGPSPGGVAAGSGAELADAGLRAVKDFEEPRRLYRLVVAGAADDDRPLRTLEPPSNLPGDVTDLVGREEEIERLSGVVDGNRIVTLTGPGGSGKTRLALGVAQAVKNRFPHGTWFIDLAAVRDPGMLEPAVASTLGLRESPERPMPTRSVHTSASGPRCSSSTTSSSCSRRAPTSCATIARGAPDVRFLVTSRELLRIGGERGHPVPPLGADAGVALFEARATSLPARPRARRGRSRRRTQIAERLFGLPLAIELAAARVRLLSPALILERLTSEPRPRRRLARPARAPAHAPWRDGLEPRPAFRAGAPAVPAARGLRRRLDGGALPRSSPTPTGAWASTRWRDSSRWPTRASSGSSRRARPTERTDEARFDLHPLLREYALERLEGSGERGDVEARHAGAIADLAERLGSQILSAGGSAAIRRLDLEQHNVRAVLDWSIRTGETEIGLRVIAAIWRWFQQRGACVRRARRWSSS